MIKLGLVTWALTLGQLPDRSEWLVAPQYVPGLELVYSGSYLEKSLIPSVEHKREYRLETTVFVMDRAPRHWDVGVMTVLSLRTSRTGGPREPDAASPSSVRLELGEVDANGRLVGKKDAPLLLPLDGPPTIECGGFVEFPPTRVGKLQPWPVTEAGRPPRTWHIAGVEQKNGSLCLKLIGEQQSEEWDRPRADRAAWRRRDTVWVMPQLGIAMRVERLLEHRRAGARDPTFIGETSCDLASQLRYSPSIAGFSDRRGEIAKAHRFSEELRVLAQKPQQYRAHLDALAHKIQYHLDHHPPTPYRKAVLHVQRSTDKARKGEALVEAPVEDASPLTALKVGQRVPDFVVTELTGSRSARLYRPPSRPTLVFFYNPATDSGRNVLRFVRILHEQMQAQVGFLALATSHDVELIRQQHREMDLPFPVMDGQGMLVTFGVDATPRFVILDADGVVRAAYTGWGTHVPRDIVAQLRELVSAGSGHP
jgi:hypothetical protein